MTGEDQTNIHRYAMTVIKTEIPLNLVMIPLSSSQEYDKGSCQNSERRLRRDDDIVSGCVFLTLLSVNPYPYI
jgi:hypothetical protein